MRKLGITALAVAALAIAATFTASSCGQTPTNVPIRTFEGAQKVAVVCLEVNDPITGLPEPAPIPVAQNLCAPGAPGVVGALLPYHLLATVTQTTRGELAVVDLTAGAVIDEDESTPGVNFIPVGTNPTDVVVSPGNAPDRAFVASASPTKPAIYAVPTSRLMGDSTTTKTAPLALTDLVACSLSQQPRALGIVNLATPGADGGSPAGTAADAGGVADGGADGGDDAGSASAIASGSAPSDYRILALLGDQGSAAAKVVVIDPAPLHDGTPGALPACTVVGSLTLSKSVVPSEWVPGPSWPDGIPYVDGGAGDLSDSEPPVVCAATLGTGVGTMPAPPIASEAGAGVDGAAPGIDGGALDAGVEAVDAEANDDAEPEDAEVHAALDAAIASALDAGSSPTGNSPTTPTGADAGIPIPVSPLSSPSPVTMVMRDDAPLLYVADSSLPVIHVIDLTDPTAPVETAPLLATSVTQPTRQVQVGGLALSPPTRDYKRFIYAIDTTLGSLMVFDVSDPVASPHVPLLRPHPELNPFVPLDRLAFAAPVATVAFAQHDWPLLIPNTTTITQSVAYQGLLCNPNPNAHPNSSTFVDLGAYYRVDQAGTIQANATNENFPSRLRGIFAFATLTNGSVVTIDVDDWDAPCRRPDPMNSTSATPNAQSNSLQVPQPQAGPADLDPYHVPLAYNPAIPESAAVTLETFYPVSAPHRMRSSVLLLNDPSSGDHNPSVVQPPQLSDVNGTPLSTSGNAGVSVPLILPTVLDPGFYDPTIVQNPTEPNPAERTTVPEAGTSPNPQSSPAPGVRLSFEDPTVQQNQDWTVTYEGALPGSVGAVATIQSTAAETTPDAYTTLTFASQGADLCSMGIEDWSIGQARATQALSAMDPKLVAATPGQSSLPTWTSDYVEITDDILPQGDAYWTVQGNACWDIPQVPGVQDHAANVANVANARFNLCQSAFGTPGIGLNPDLDVARDAPILQAYKDHLVVGRFGFSSQVERTQNRSIDPGSSFNPPWLKELACCFHKQAGYKVRAGGEWVAVGQQSVALLHHVIATPTADPSQSRCVLSCDPNDRLLNARSFDVPWASPAACAATTQPPIGRNDVLAMRNPMFSYVTWAGCGSPAVTGDHTLSARDMTWRFSLSGGFTPLTISIAGTSGATVSPQSMLFINSFGQLAVVDGAEQGLVIIDLNTVGVTNNFY